MTENERKEIYQLLLKLDIKATTDEYEVSRKIRETYHELPNISVAGGASKVCLVFDDRDYVIKWSTDYCDEAHAEVQIYQKAVQNGLAEFFPRTEMFDVINNIEFVYQEKVDFSCYCCPPAKENRYRRTSRTGSADIVQKMQKEFNKAGKFKRELNVLWAKMALVIYGKHKCKALCNFIVKNRINDLHDENIGYKNNRPVLLDFSGYHRNDDDSFSDSSDWGYTT